MHSREPEFRPGIDGERTPRARMPSGAGKRMFPAGRLHPFSFESLALSRGGRAGELSLSGRCALLLGVLLINGAGLALAARLAAEARAQVAQAPGIIIQAGWIEASPAEPSPLPMREESPPATQQERSRSRPKPRPKPEPLLARPADAASVAQAAPEWDTPRVEEETEPEAKEDASKTSAAASEGQGAPALAGERGNAASGPIILASHAGYLSNPKPPYPSASRARREEGKTFLRVRVSANGKVDAVALHRSCGYEQLDRAALETLWRWRFHPARQGGRPVESEVIVPIHFSLRD
ncbi:MAG: energy transducer TonB [Zoogloeaceae bacterium]|nr:energy transducer TonB [Zoogloeaceae bacterium]